MFSENETREQTIEPLRLVNDITGKNGATAVLPTCSRTMVNDITGENGATAVLSTCSTTRTRNYDTLVRRQKYEDSIKVFRLSTIRLK